ncbi:MAG: YggS family pyridoxal phosphate-dependent enzyme [Candidatus Omnitrophica bacterium]|nr:YggS family pyridoxal phosphate-dependent enzyme [Candidatus Omnitrophota bacterium]MDD5310435.1 YggS family pyridoxal phosphate-dependent enzyme [Candidatus Omnitrophota bacterium]MDD5546721.1 YggS family pyridoxal phosphate-dependent enzyme [Candidatus Omnitrophota bacterium]
MIPENIRGVKERIRLAAGKIGKNDRDITLVCVTKTVDVPRIEEALAAGVTDIGENYVQAAEIKFKAIEYRAKWHLIGHLQTNKVKEAVRMFDLIHSVDSLKLAEEISKRSAGLLDPKKVLIEVKTSEEATKYGVLPEQALPLIEKIAVLPHIKVMGLMTMAPFTENPEDSRPYFERLKKLSLLILTKRIRNVDMRYLSMGMTQDFEVAIEEGANIIRIGHAIFGG